MITITPTNSNGRAAATESWLALSVREFFTTVNWENKPPEVQQLSQELVISARQGTASPLSLNLTVSQFFGAIPWDGAAIASLPVQTDDILLSDPTNGSDFTLEGFSDLFG